MNIWDNPIIMDLAKAPGAIPFPDRLFAKLQRNVAYPMDKIMDRLKHPKEDAEGTLWQVLPPDMDEARFEKLCQTWHNEGLITYDPKHKVIWKR